MFDQLIAAGFDVEFHHHAQAILAGDFPEVEPELEKTLLASTIPIEEIIAGGGGEAKGTQRLRRALTESGWPKFVFRIERRINDVPSESISHEIDHVKTFAAGDRIALEIEWNNKDPFYDRDLENFKRLHADGAISIGMIITRGLSLHSEMHALVSRFLEERQIGSLPQLAKWGYEPTFRQRAQIERRVTRSKNPVPFRRAVADQFVADKFGEATTHWRKLEDRVYRGVGNPCPLVLIGLPSSIVTFHEGKAALHEIEAAASTEA